MVAAAPPASLDSQIFCVNMPPTLLMQDDSPSLLNDASPFQVERRNWQPELPYALRSPVRAVTDENITIAKPAADKELRILKEIFPQTYGQHYVKLEPCSDATIWDKHKPLRLGIVLSGGQAAGGHNVIAGVFDYIKQCNSNSQLFGFLSGPHGVFSSNYKEIDADFMNKYRNQGGFDMICSGRHKIETEEQKKASMQTAQRLDLHGLVVVGGDDSNTNAAVLGEYFKASGCSTVVVGCPKTIDGDLRNEYVETSFGFDTAVKTYSELIGNLCTDVATSQNRYHFVRLMGRSASNIALECAMQTRPNLCFIGEEVQATKRTLHSIVEEIVDLVESRAKEGKHYGVVLLPEGLIEFIPEVGICIQEINDILASGPFEESKLSPNSQSVFKELPLSVRDELLLERDPHGNVQVARIATEKLLILMTHSTLERRGTGARFRATAHYFGYEGRCAMPSNFDANYCYALGHVAGALVDLNLNAYMAVLQGLKNAPSEWSPGGCPLQGMMTVERRKGKETPVIRKYLVELDKPLFKLFMKARETWKLMDCYRNPGPIQFSGPTANLTNFTIVPPTETELMPPAPFGVESLKQRYNFIKSEAYLSPLQREALRARIEVTPLLTKPTARAVEGPKSQVQDQQGQKFVNRAFPLQCARHKTKIYNVVDESPLAHPPESTTPAGAAVTAAATQHPKDFRIGVVLQGQQAPGSSNVLHGLFERLRITGGSLFGFKGITGLLEAEYIEITKEDLKLHFNQGGFELLGRTKETKSAARTEPGLAKVLATCQKLRLDGLVMIGGQSSLTDAALVTEYMLSHDCKTVVIGVPATQENNLRHSLIEACIGFDSTSKCYSSLIGNLLTDAASATKYWYFVRLMGQVPSHMVLEAAIQTHPTMTIVSEKYSEAGMSLYDVVSNIADVVCERANKGKNFGTVLIPEGLISQLPNLKQLFLQLDTIVRTVKDDAEFAQLRAELVDCQNVPSPKYLQQLEPWLQAILKTLPHFFRSRLIQKSQLELSEIPTEMLLSQMVGEELRMRKAAGKYKGSFTAVCHYFGFQGRSTMPSIFDCQLGLAYGYLAGILVEANITGYVTSIRGLCAHPANWKLSAVPITALMKVMPQRETALYGREVPMVPCAEVDLQGKPYACFASVAEQWEAEECPCNPGPIQFAGSAAGFLNKTLYLEQHAYLEMLGQLEYLTKYIEAVCTFGVDETTLRTTILSLEGLTKILQNLQTAH